MIAGVADTHAALWYLFGDPRLSASAKSFIDHAAASGTKVAVSVISLAEILYLVEKKRLPPSAYDRLRHALVAADYVVDEVPLTAAIVEAMKQVPRAEVPDSPIGSSQQQAYTSTCRSLALTAAFGLRTSRLFGNEWASRFRPAYSRNSTMVAPAPPSCCEAA